MEEQKLRGQSFGTLALLAAQFILGMVLNLFVTLPRTHPGQQGNYFVRSGHTFGWAITVGGGVALFLHVLVALVLLGSSISLFVRAVKSHKQFWIWVSGIGLLGILAAFSNGLAFLDFNHDSSSFIMAMGYILATVSYGMGVFLGPTTQASQRQKMIH